MQAQPTRQTIRVATWNMAYWPHRAMLDDAWTCYMEIAKADVYLFQEGRPAAATKQPQHLVWNEIGGSRDWGSGIYSPEHEIVEEDIGSKFNGALTIGRADIGRRALTLISLYGLMESNGPTKGYAIPNLHRMFSDLTGLLNGHIGGRRDIILGGDLNASTQLDPIQNNRSNELLFARIADFGLQDVYVLSGNKSHVQTLRNHRSVAPWQNDYLFVSKQLGGGLKGYQVIDNDEVRKFSDHNIVLMELEL